MNRYQRRGAPQTGLLVYLVDTLLIAGLLALAGLLAGGCASRVVVLSHPETRHVVECRAARGAGGGPAMGGSGVESCVTAYRRAGYVVVGDSN